MLEGVGKAWTPHGEVGVVYTETRDVGSVDMEEGRTCWREEIENGVKVWRLFCPVFTPNLIRVFWIVVWAKLGR